VAVSVTCFVAYAYFYQAGGWNQNSRFALVRALVERHTAAVDAYRGASWDLSCKALDGPCANKKRPNFAAGEHLYSDKAPGSALLGLPAYAVAYWIAGGPHPGAHYLDATSYLVTITAVALPSAAAVGALLLLLGALGLSPWRRAAAALAYGLGTLAFPYATLYYGHQLAAALLLLGFALVVRMRREVVPVTRWRLVCAGLALGGAVAVEYPAGLALVAIGAYAAVGIRPWKRLGWLALGVAVPGLITAAYHWIVFGGPLSLPYDFSVQDNRSQGFFMGIGAPRWPAVKGILFTGYRGIFHSAPWLFAAIPGAVLALRRGYRQEVLVCAGIFTLFVIMNGSLVDWSGGWAAGARYLVPALPFLAVLAGCVLLGESPRHWAGVWVATGLGAVYAAYLMLVVTAVKPEVPDAWVEPPRKLVRVEQPFAQYLLPRFWRGELATNTQGIDQGGVRRDGPEFLGPRRAFNLGQLVGLDGLPSLIPLILLLGAGGVWVGWAARRQTRES